MEKTPAKYTFYSILTAGALCLMLLKFFNKSGILSMILVTLALTAYVWASRHAQQKKQLAFMAVSLSVSYAVRLIAYTATAVDIAIGILIGLAMFVLLRAEMRFKKHKDNPLFCLIFPVLFFAFLFFTEALKLNLPCRLGTYFSSWKLLIQSTALAGTYFPDFLLVLTASVLVFIFDHGLSSRSFIAAGAYAALFSAVLIYGALHVEAMTARDALKTDSVRVACAAGPYSGNYGEAAFTTYSFEENLTSLETIVRTAAEENADILILSEEAYTISDTEEKAFLACAARLAISSEMHILLAYESCDTDNSTEGRGINKICWISDTGEILYDYTKYCIIPIIESFDYVKGREFVKPFTIHVKGRTLNVASVICYDSDFDLFMRHMGKNIDILFVPTWDWDAISEEHFSIACMRAAASQTTLVRSVYDGWSAVIDSTGTPLTQNHTDEAGFETVLLYDVPVNPNNNVEK